MPWKEQKVENTRQEFVAEAIRKEKSFSALCREYNVTRKTGYKWVERYRAGEPLSNYSHRPETHPHKTRAETEELIVQARIAHPAWGARKLKRYLENQGHTNLPVQSTICSILNRRELVEAEASLAHIPVRRFERDKANELWQADFKGDFGMMDSTRCFPLTVLDDHSRYSLAIEAKSNQRQQGVQASFSHLFSQYGMPDSLLCDNGAPWGCSQGGFTCFEVWLMQHDILPIHGRPLHPQTQGKEERFHRTMKEELLKRTVIENLAHAQKTFDAWRRVYNHERPHAALDLDVPAKRFRVSKPRYPPDRLPEPQYDSGKQLRKVNCKGYISLHSHRYFFSDAFIGKYMELVEEKDDILSLCYGAFRVARVDLKEQCFLSKRIFRRSSSPP